MLWSISAAAVAAAGAAAVACGFEIRNVARFRNICFLKQFGAPAVLILKHEMLPVLEKSVFFR